MMKRISKIGVFWWLRDNYCVCRLSDTMHDVWQLFSIDSPLFYGSHFEVRKVEEAKKRADNLNVSQASRTVA